MSAKIGGIVPPVVVPLTQERELDQESYARSINRMIEAGVDALFVLGSSGEVAFSSGKRREEILAVASETIAGRVPLLAGIIDTQSERMLEHLRQAEKYQVDGVVATAPFYALGGETEVEQSFRRLKSQTDLPVFAYDIPVCVHRKLSPQLLLKLGREGVIAGVKDSSGDDVSFRFLALQNQAEGHPLQLLTGHEVVVDGAYMSGADGAVPGLANVDPEGYVRQWQAYQNRNWEQVRQEQDRLARLMQIVNVTSGVSGFGAGVGAFKTALQLLGVFTTNQMPHPVAALEGDNVKAIARVLEEVGLL